jgi:protein gp37
VNGKYWDKGIQLVDGCTPCSPGCDHCWSAAMENRFHGGGGRYYDLVTNGKYNGRVMCMSERLTIPLKRKKPTVYAVWNDFHHPSVTDDFKVLAYRPMVSSKQHTFLILTKRPQVMADFLSPATCFARPAFDNIYNGLTVCNQQEADEKIPTFLQVPGKKFLSIEPMLGPVDLEPYLLQWRCPECGGWNYGSSFCSACEREQWENLDHQENRGINAVLLGFETGPGARPGHPDWARKVRDDCAAAGVPFFFKGWGNHIPSVKDLIESDAGEYSRQVFPTTFREQRRSRLLDGREHNDLPWRSHAT